MSLIVDILACSTSEQVSIYLSEMSEQELGEALDEVELVNAGDRRSKIRRFRNYVFVRRLSAHDSRGTGSDFKVGGGQQSPSTSAEKASKDTNTEKEVICFRCQKPGHYQAGCPLPRKLACYRCKTEGYTTKNCPKCSGNGEKKQ